MTQTEAPADQAAQIYNTRAQLGARLAVIAAAVERINAAHEALIQHVERLYDEDVSEARAVTTNGPQQIANAFLAVVGSCYMLYPDPNLRPGIQGIPEPEHVFPLPAAVRALYDECSEPGRLAKWHHDQARERDKEEENRRRRKARFAQLLQLRQQRDAVLAEGNVPDTVLTTRIRTIETEFGISS